jgi:hypothetical protein
MPVKPITGMLRRGLVLDLSVAFGMSPPFRPASDVVTRPGRREEEPLGVAIWLHMFYGRLTCGPQVSVPLLATSGGTVRKVNLRPATRQTSSTTRNFPRQTQHTTLRAPPTGDSVILTRTAHRLPRPRRPPPRHVLRQA